MTYKGSRISGLRTGDPELWVQKIEKAMRDSGGRIDPAAEALGTSRRTLLRWLALPELQHIERAPPGRPKKDDAE